MMFFSQPPQELFQDLPEGVTLESAVKTWQGGFAVGYHGKPYHDMEYLELAPFFADGYHRGKQERAVNDELNQAMGTDEALGDPVSQWERAKQRVQSEAPSLLWATAFGAGALFGGASVVSALRGDREAALVQGGLACFFALTAQTWDIRYPSA